MQHHNCIKRHHPNFHTTWWTWHQPICDEFMLWQNKKPSLIHPTSSITKTIRLLYLLNHSAPKCCSISQDRVENFGVITAASVFRLLRPAQSWQDISISCDISITSPFSVSIHLNGSFARGKHVGFANTSPPLPPLMYWPALARWDGPLDARHATLEGQCSATPHPYCCSVHILQRNLWPLILHPTPHNFGSALCWGIKVGCAWAWVAGAAFLTFHFLKSDLVTFGRRVSVGLPLSPSPHPQSQL